MARKHRGRKRGHRMHGHRRKRRKGIHGMNDWTNAAVDTGGAIVGAMLTQVGLNMVYPALSAMGKKLIGVAPTAIGFVGGRYTKGFMKAGFMGMAARGGVNVIRENIPGIGGIMNPDISMIEDEVRRRMNGPTTVGKATEVGKYTTIGDVSVAGHRMDEGGRGENFA